MPRLFERNCDECGKHYKGVGAKFCSLECAFKSKREYKKCEVCGKQIQILNRGKANRFCSKKCQNLGMQKRVYKKCAVCEKEFWVRKHNETARHCSRKCADIGRVNRKIIECLKCGKLFPVWESEGSRKFCSESCYREYSVSENHPSYKPELREKIECSQCGKMFIQSKHQRKRPGKKFCSARCVSDFQCGENNWAWKGGKSFEPYSPEFNPYTKRRIKERDNYKCQICGALEQDSNHKHHIHHIDYDKMNCSDDNLITLCIFCHSETSNRDREYWTIVLKDHLKYRLTKEGRNVNESIHA